jgi:cyclase
VLKRRIAAMLVVRDGIVVQSIGFRRYLPVGKPAIAIEFLNDWGVDEILLLDISASRAGRPPDFDMVNHATVGCRVPLAVGGGVTHLDHVRQLMHAGADKVCFNQAALHQPSLLGETARVFGDQCVVASIDSVATDAGPRVFDYRTGAIRSEAPAELARRMQDLGAGEILINSVDRDGSRRGFDLDLVRSVCDAVSLPVICCGGAGGAGHFAEVLTNTGASAAAAGNFFHFTEHSVTTVKARVSREVPVRHDSHATYLGACFDDAGRLLKRSDQELESMRFVMIEKEVI